MKLVTIILGCGTITIDIRRLTTPYYYIYMSTQASVSIDPSTFTFTAIL
jgi:hypothetical protein